MTKPAELARRAAGHGIVPPLRRTVETARALAAAGAAVILGVRRLDAGRQIAAQITETTGNGNVTAAILDVADLVAP